MFNNQVKHVINEYMHNNKPLFEHNHWLMLLF